MPLDNPPYDDRRPANIFVSSEGGDSSGRRGKSGYPFATINAAMTAAVAGDKIRMVGPGPFGLPLAAAQLGWWKNYITLQGEGMPGYNAGLTALVGGTRVFGPLDITARNVILRGIHLCDFGLDNGSDICTAEFSGVAQEGLGVTGDDGVTGVPESVVDLQIRNFISLGHMTSPGATHAMSLQNVADGVVSNAFLIGSVHPLAVKSKRMTLNGIHVTGTTPALGSQDAIFIGESGAGLPCQDIVINGLTVNGGQGVKFSNGCRNVTVNGYAYRGPANATIFFMDVTSIQDQRGIHINGFTAEGTLGASVTIVSSTSASPGVITTSGNHGFSNGEAVLVAGIAGAGATVLNGAGVVNVVSPTQFSIGINTTGAGTGGTVALMPMNGISKAFAGSFVSRDNSINGSNIKNANVGADVWAGLSLNSVAVEASGIGLQSITAHSRRDRNVTVRDCAYGMNRTAAVFIREPYNFVGSRINDQAGAGSLSILPQIYRMRSWTAYVTNSIAESSVITSTEVDGTRVIPAALGTRTMIVRAGGAIERTGTPTVTIRLKLGALSLCVDVVTPTADGRWSAIWTTQIRDGLADASAPTHVVSQIIAGPVALAGGNGGLASPDWTGNDAARTLDVTAQWNVADAANKLSCDQMTVELPEWSLALMP